MRIRQDGGNYSQGFSLRIHLRRLLRVHNRNMNQHSSQPGISKYIKFESDGLCLKGHAEPAIHINHAKLNDGFSACPSSTSNLSIMNIHWQFQCPSSCSKEQEFQRNARAESLKKQKDPNSERVYRLLITSHPG